MGDSADPVRQRSRIGASPPARRDITDPPGLSAAGTGGGTITRRG